MKWISNYRFECQKPGIMAPARTRAAKTGHARWTSVDML
jgi:hypothetical protein